MTKPFDMKEVRELLKSEEKEFDLYGDITKKAIQTYIREMLNPILEYMERMEEKIKKD